MCPPVDMELSPLYLITAVFKYIQVTLLQLIIICEGSCQLALSFHRMAQCDQISQDITLRISKVYLLLAQFEETKEIISLHTGARIYYSLVKHFSFLVTNNNFSIIIDHNGIVYKPQKASLQ